MGGKVKFPIHEHWRACWDCNEDDPTVESDAVLRAGWVYIASRTDGAIKVGHGRTPVRERLQANTYVTKQKHELIHAVSLFDHFHLEQWLHWLLAPMRYERREWYQLPAVVIGALARVDHLCSVPPPASADALPPAADAYLARIKEAMLAAGHTPPTGRPRPVPYRPPRPRIRVIHMVHDIEGICAPWVPKPPLFPPSL